MFGHYGLLMGTCGEISNLCTIPGTRLQVNTLVHRSTAAPLTVASLWIYLTASPYSRSRIISLYQCPSPRIHKGGFLERYLRRPTKVANSPHDLQGRAGHLSASGHWCQIIRYHHTHPFKCRDNQDLDKTSMVVLDSKTESNQLNIHGLTRVETHQMHDKLCVLLS
ncbi:hypothetical protein BKA81DRAFT_51835 [Phyllosticta paracitricarpa]